MDGAFRLEANGDGLGDGDEESQDDDETPDPAGKPLAKPAAEGQVEEQASDRERDRQRRQGEERLGGQGRLLPTQCLSNMPIPAGLGSDRCRCCAWS